MDIEDCCNCFYFFGALSIININAPSLLDYFFHLAEITGTGKWFWVCVWIASLISFCVAPVISGITLFIFARNFKKTKIKKGK